MSDFDLSQKFHDALTKLKGDYEKGTVQQSDLDRLAIWAEFLNVKVDAERELNAREVSGDKDSD